MVTAGRHQYLLTNTNTSRTSTSTSTAHQHQPPAPAYEEPSQQQLPPTATFYRSHRLPHPFPFTPSAAHPHYQGRTQDFLKGGKFIHV